jgi:hypothetical protein
MEALVAEPFLPGLMRHLQVKSVVRLCQEKFGAKVALDGAASAVPVNSTPYLPPIYLEPVYLIPCWIPQYTLALHYAMLRPHCSSHWKR